MNLYQINIKNPFFCLLLFYIAGIGLQIQLSIELHRLHWIVFSGLLVLIALKWMQRRSPVKWCLEGAILLFSLLIGMLNYGIRQPGVQRTALEPYIPLQSEIEFEGVVYRISTSHNGKQSFMVAINTYAKNDTVWRGESMVKVHLKDKVHVDEGDLIAGFGTITALNSNANPYVFNYSKYLSNNGVLRQIYADHVAVKKKHTKLILKLRKHVNEALQFSHLSELSKGIIESMLLGNKNNIGAIAPVFRQTGTAHVLAISGFHVGIIAGILLFLTKRMLGNNVLIRNITVVMGVFFYTIITGAQPSTIRAAIMLGLIFFSPLLKRKVQPINMLLGVAYCMLLYAPNMLFNVGFQFSFLAVLGIFLFYKRIVAIYRVKNRFLQYLWSSFVVSLCAQVFILPLSLFYFHAFPVYFVLGTWIAIPGCVLVIILGFINLLVALVGIQSAFLATTTDFLIDVFYNSLVFIAELPNAQMLNIWPSKAAIILYLLLIVSLLYSRGKWVQYMRYLTFCGLIFSCYLNISQKQKPVLILYAHKHHWMFDVVSNQQVFRFKEDGAINRTYDHQGVDSYFNIKHFREKHLKSHQNYLFQMGNQSWFILNQEVDLIDQNVDVIIVNTKLKKNLISEAKIYDFANNTSLKTAFKQTPLIQKI